MEYKIDIQALRDAQDSKLVALHAFDAKRGFFRFIDNCTVTMISTVELVPVLQDAKELKNVSLLGTLTLLQNAGLTAETLREKGALITLESLVELTHATVRNYKRNDRITLKTMGKVINSILNHWKSGFLAQSDQLLNQQLNARAINIMSNQWFRNFAATNDELVNILRKRIARHIQNETCAYLQELAVRQDDPIDQKTGEDRHTLIIGKINYEHRLADADRAQYADKIGKKMHIEYFAQGAKKAALNQAIKQIRDLHVLKCYQDSQLSKSLMQMLDTKLCDHIISAIRGNDVNFAKESPELSRWICEEAHAKQKGRAVDRMHNFNALVVADLIKSLKKGRINTDMQRELASYLMPLIEDLRFEKDDEENEVILQAVASIIQNPSQLVEAARAQFVDSVTVVITNVVKAQTEVAENEAGRALIGLFCGEILNNLNSSQASEYFNDPDMISCLFNKDEVALLGQIELRTKTDQRMFASQPETVVNTTSFVAANKRLLGPK